MKLNTKTVLAVVALSVAGMSGVADAEELVGLTNRQQIVRFDSGAPGTFLSASAITGLVGANERIVGIDFRPANAQIYGVSSEDRVYIIDRLTGVATAVSATPLAVPYFAGGEVDIDFNPLVDRTRYVSGSFNARINQLTGFAVDGNAGLAGIQSDTALNYVAGDANFGVVPNAGGTAYTNPDVNPATGTRQYTIDSSLAILSEQTNFNGGLLSSIGALNLGRPLGANYGFDISESGVAYLGFNELPIGAQFINYLYSVNLATGQSTLLSSSIPATSGGLVDVAAIPEPTALSLLVAAGLVVGRRRSR